ncbi:MULTISPECIES: hypothetical protein [Sphingobacterium]|uniref:Lipoprotein n=1 Tax=Sphingobacterium cellulitidis TaxID=1768011 RepID=A0A8H9G1D9_9SPHI|nr:MULTISPECIES: hypothetical protein [Sphingobacterium]MBA8987764.1 hypothetical protein [Sphingobacterium soli]WFB64432.1 hypothetical protein PZ892_04300 [Sphingobacterium sp. WM]GGE22836.1 hypothetical protein GCM10011516_20650 [Sphingobacterium soli]
MKTKLFSILAASALAFTACSTDNTVKPIDKKGEENLIGKITKNTTLDANIEYTMTGAVYVQDGVTLTIPAGTVIKALDGGTDVYLMVERGGKIMANGTADKPIVFTSKAAKPKEGDWGGVLINGKAPISGDAGKVTENNAEIGEAFKYGGSVVDDNSGILNYVRIEYTGARISEEKEHNGLTLNGVGNKTTLSNIYLAYGDDDAIEFFGGSVNATNILVVNCTDDMFDFTEGYSGTVKNVYGIREEGYLPVTVDPRGIEADGNMDGKAPTHVNQSNFKVDGITIINNAPGLGANLTMHDVFKIRRGAKATITNAFVKFGPKTNVLDDKGAVVVDLADYTDKNGDAAAGTSIEYTIVKENNLDKAKVKTVTGTTATAKDGLKGADVSAFGWTKYKF